MADEEGQQSNDQEILNDKEQIEPEENINNEQLQNEEMNQTKERESTKIIVDKDNNCMYHEEQIQDTQIKQEKTNEVKDEDNNKQQKEEEAEPLIDPIALLQIISLSQELKQERQVRLDLELEKERDKQTNDKRSSQLEQDNRLLKSEIQKLKQDTSKEDLMKENTTLKDKLKALKDSVLLLKERLDTDIYSKLELKSKLLKETLQINEQLENKIELLTSEEIKNKSLEDQLRMYRDKFNEELKEKVNMQTFAQRQESTIKSLEMTIASLEESIQEKDIKYNQLDKTYLSIIRVIEEQKKTIRNLQDKVLRRQSDEKSIKLLLYEKDQEILLLRSFVTSLKNENASKIQTSNLNYVNRSKAKGKGVVMESKYKLTKQSNQYQKTERIDENDLGNSKSFRIENSNSNKNFITVNDPEEDNLKEITSIMKKILDE